MKTFKNCPSTGLIHVCLGPYMLLCAPISDYWPHRPERRDLRGKHLIWLRAWIFASQSYHFFHKKIRIYLRKMCLRQGLWVLSAILTVILPNSSAHHGPNHTNNLELNPNKTGQLVHTNHGQTTNSDKVNHTSKRHDHISLVAVFFY